MKFRVWSLFLDTKPGLSTASLSCIKNMVTIVEIEHGICHIPMDSIYLIYTDHNITWFFSLPMYAALIFPSLFRAFKHGVDQRNNY